MPEICDDILLLPVGNYSLTLCPMQLPYDYPHPVSCHRTFVVLRHPLEVIIGPSEFTEELKIVMITVAKY